MASRRHHRRGQRETPPLKGGPPRTGRRGERPARPQPRGRRSEPSFSSEHLGNTSGWRSPATSRMARARSGPGVQGRVRPSQGGCRVVGTRTSTPSGAISTSMSLTRNSSGLTGPYWTSQIREDVFPAGSRQNLVDEGVRDRPPRGDCHRGHRPPFSGGASATSLRTSSRALSISLDQFLRPLFGSRDGSELSGSWLARRPHCRV